MNHKLAVALAASINLSLVEDASAQIEKCAAVLVPDQVDSARTGTLDQAFRDAFCKKSYDYLSESSESGGAIGGELFEVVKIDLSGSHTSQRLRVKRDEYCRDTSLRISSSEATRLMLRIVPREAREQWGRCVAQVTAPRPLATSFEVSGSSVIVKLRWDRDHQPSPQPRLASAQGINLKCNDRAIRGRPIPSTQAGRTIACTWLDAYQTHGAVMIRTTNSGDDVLAVSREVPPDGQYTLEYGEPFEEDTGTKCTRARTPELHEARCDSRNRYRGRRCDACLDRHRFCFRRVAFPIQADQGHRLRPTGYTARCRADNSGACGWNAVGDARRLQTDAVQDASLVLSRLFSSRSVEVEVCAKQYRIAQRPVKGSLINIYNGTLFTVKVPKNATTPVLRVVEGRQTYVVEFGKSAQNLHLLEIVQAADGKLATYVLRKPRGS